MADSQGVPVFLRHVDEPDPLFVGRFALAEIPELLTWLKSEGCFFGADLTSEFETRFIAYANPSQNCVGFEIIGFNDSTEP